MIEELIENGEYLQALKHLHDMNDETTRYLRLVCLIGLGEYEKARVEGIHAKSLAKETYYDVVSMYIMALKESAYVHLIAVTDQSPYITNLHYNLFYLITV